MTPKQERFVAEYLIDLNAKQAAIRAGYSAKTATEQGYANLRKVHVAKAIENRRIATGERVELTQEWVLDRLSDHVARAIQAEPTAASCLRALELLGKHLGMFGEKLEHGGTVKHEHYDARVPPTDKERRNRLLALFRESAN